MTCRGCGKPIEQKQYGRRRKFCCEACRRKVDRAHYQQTVKANRKRKICKRPGCHNLLTSEGRGRPSDYCCKQCKRARTVKVHEDRLVISDAIRKAVFARDGYKCLSCGSRAFLQVDHIVAAHNGGPDWMVNYQTLCRECNRRKGTRTIRYEGSPKI